MLDIKFIRENKDIVALGAKKKHIDIDIDKLLAVDDKRRELQLTIDNKRSEQNVASDAIARAKSDAEKQEVMKEWRAMMVMVPNVPDMSVPEGDSDPDNQEIRVWGELPKFSFEPKTHSELLLAHDMADYERGAKVAGFRGYFLKNDGARLVWALQRFVEERFSKKDFTPMIVPSMVRRRS